MIKNEVDITPNEIIDIVYYTQKQIQDKHKHTEWSWHNVFTDLTPVIETTDGNSEIALKIRDVGVAIYSLDKESGWINWSIRMMGNPNDLHVTAKLVYIENKLPEMKKYVSPLYMKLFPEEI